MKVIRARELVVGCCLVILFCIMCTILGRVFITQILVKRMGVNNYFTQIVIKGIVDDREKRVSIDWGKKYPFADSKVMKQERNFYQKIQSKQKKIYNMESKIATWSGNYLVGYHWIIENKMKYDRTIDWEIYRQDGVLVKRIGSGNWSHICPKVDMTEKIDSLLSFEKFCKGENIPLLFVQAPNKISRGLEKSNSVLASACNANADEVVQALREKHISVLDLRDEIERLKIDNSTLFFKTDHHWKPETAFWAASLISERLHKMPEIELNYDTLLSAPQNFDKKIYKRNFLGSNGRALTLVRCEPEDISLFFPRTKTDFAISIPEIGIHERGDFSIMYDMSQVRAEDYYQKNSYATYAYGDRAYIRIVNHMQKENNLRILLVKDSFADAVEPFLALNVRSLDVIDLRAFTGSLRTFIQKNKPDIVIVLYNPSSESKKTIQWDSHTDPFDFR